MMVQFISVAYMLVMVLSACLYHYDKAVPVLIIPELITYLQHFHPQNSRGIYYEEIIDDIYLFKENSHLVLLTKWIISIVPDNQHGIILHK